jgi:Asp-tRNA(Asn)/Glu-tRNA(Gln) amidotransferase A subunit family amidase
MRIKIIFNKHTPTGYETFTKYMENVNAEIEDLEKQGFIIIDVDVREFRNEEPYTQIKYRTK